MSWVETLKQYNQSHQPPEQEESYQQKEQRVLAELRAIYEERARKRKEERRAAKQKARAEAAAAAGAAGSGPKERKGASTSEIPRFYIQRTTSPPPADPEPPVDGDGTNEGNGEVPPAPMPSLPALVRREARTRYLEQRADQLLDDRDLAVLWEALQAQSVDAKELAAQAKAEAEAEQGKNNGSSNSKPKSSLPTLPTVPSSPLEVDKRLSYSSFLSVSHSLPDRCKHASSRFFTASTFLSFPVDGYGCISARALWRYISKKVQLTRLRISLTCYDDVGYGYLREQDLENYVYDQLASLPPLQGLERDFYPYYVFTAVRKFFFFLDPHKRGKLRIKNIVHSPVMLEFDSLRYPAGYGGGGPHNTPNALGGPLGGGVGKKLSANSWFSAQHTQDVYAIYLGLDTNQNGMLSRREFQAYNGGNLTRIFVEALFAEYRMYPSSATGEENPDGWLKGEGEDSDAGENELEMDYKTFLDFMLAMQYKSSPASIAYFFKVLDIHHQGYLDVFTLTYWFRAVAERMVALGHEPIDVADVVCNEIFDMVNPTATPGRITLQDLISSRCGHTVVSILIDVNGFWRYDNRESLMQSQEEE